MPLTPDRDAIFIHIPKCAGTSVEIAMGYGRRYPTLGESRTVTSPDYDGLFGGGLQHLSIGEVRENHPRCLARVKLRFAIIRHPIERMISAFGWQKYRFNHDNLPAIPVLVEEFESWFDERLHFLENNSVLAEPRQGILSAEHAFDTPAINEGEVRHLMPQTGFIYWRGKYDVDLLINFDAVSETRDILKNFDIHVGPLPHKMKSIDATGVRKSVSEKCRKRIMDLYHDDLELYENFQGRAYVTTAPADAGAKRAASCSNPSKKPGAEHHIPKKLFLYWHQGWNNAPDLVKRCAETWQTRNSTWAVHLLDATTIAKQLELPSAVKKLQLPLPALSDVLRIALLKRYGGVWADATLWCVRPLDDWIEPVCAHSGFFAYDKSAPGRPISSWFLAASADCRIIDLWHSAVQHLLTKTLAHDRFKWVFDNQEKNRLLKAISKLCMGYISLRFRYGRWLITESDDPGDERYFWVHYLFSKLLEQNSEFQRLWASTPRISADNPHLLQYAGLLQPITERTEAIIRNRFSNVHKLARRESFPEDIGGTVLDALYRYSQG